MFVIATSQTMCPWNLQKLFFIQNITLPKHAQAIRGWVRKFCHRCYNFVNRHDRLLYYTLIERATFLLYNDVKRMHERKKFFEIDALKDTLVKPMALFLEFVILFKEKRLRKNIIHAIYFSNIDEYILQKSK